MKNIPVYLLIVFFSLFGCRSSKPLAIKSVEIPAAQQANAAHAATEKKFSDQSTWLLGYFDPAQLTREPYSEWYYTGYDNYQPKPEAMSKLNEITKNGLTIKVVMGTWCPDSRREVPRFMKILSLWQFPAQDILFIGVDNAKLSPVGEYDKLSIQRVPTFIFYKNKTEAGRIIENPVTSLEQDIVNILTGNRK